MAKAAQKQTLSNGAVMFGGDDFEAMRSTQETRRALEQLDGAYGGRIQVDFSLHAEYTSNERLVRRLVEEAAVYGGKRMHVHVSETKLEHEECKQRHGGRTPARYLCDCGLFELPTTAAHCVYAEPEDLDIFREKGVTVAHCAVFQPKVGQRRAGRAARLAARRARGPGTDGVASNNKLNMLRRCAFLRLCSAAMRTIRRPSRPRRLCAAPRAWGALSQAARGCGEIREGFRADPCAL